MIAEVGDMLKVSGSRMATPLAPPRPGSTPTMTPSTMPTTISSEVERLRDNGKAVKQITDVFEHSHSSLELQTPSAQPTAQYPR